MAMARRSRARRDRVATGRHGIAHVRHVVREDVGAHQRSARNDVRIVGGQVQTHREALLVVGEGTFAEHGLAHRHEAAVHLVDPGAELLHERPAVELETRAAGALDRLEGNAVVPDVEEPHRLAGRPDLACHRHGAGGTPGLEPPHRDHRERFGSGGAGHAGNGRAPARIRTAPVYCPGPRFPVRRKPMRMTCEELHGAPAGAGTRVRFGCVAASVGLAHLYRAPWKGVSFWRVRTPSNNCRSGW